MRYLAVAPAVGLVLALSGAQDAHAGAWCAWYDPYTYNCGFNTFEQCQATISGVGGYCARNVYESQNAGERPLRRRSRD